jgi:hypothetical protein
MCSQATKELTVRRMNYGVFELRAVSQGEFEALKRFPDYEELSDGTLMRIEGFCTALSEAYDHRYGRNKAA